MDQEEHHSFWRSDRGSLPGSGNCLLQGLQQIMIGGKCQRLLLFNDNCRPLPFHGLVAENWWFAGSHPGRCLKYDAARKLGNTPPGFMDCIVFNFPLFFYIFLVCFLWRVALFPIGFHRTHWYPAVLAWSLSSCTWVSPAWTNTEVLAARPWKCPKSWRSRFSFSANSPILLHRCELCRYADKIKQVSD